MKLTIIIPVYRVERTLDRCVQSVMAQQFADFEVILVDDGSPDLCPSICDEWARRDPRISVIHKENGGLSDARNAGIGRARGEFITFVDSDDYLADGTLAQVMPLADDADLTEYPICRNSGSASQQLLTFDEQTYDDACQYWLQARAWQHTYACNKIYRRRLFDEVRFPTGRAFEDAATLPLMLRQQPRVRTTGRGLYHYTANEQGITHTATGDELRQLLEAHLASAMPMDDAYYLSLLNIQMDVCRLTGCQPTLPMRRVRPQGNWKSMVKAVIQNTIGIKGICKLNQLTGKLRRW